MIILPFSRFVKGFANVFFLKRNFFEHFKCAVSFKISDLEQITDRNPSVSDEKNEVRFYRDGSAALSERIVFYV